MTLVVLAGGQGRRMAGPKSGLVIGGEPILTRLLSRLAWTGRRLLVTAPANRGPAGSGGFDAECVDAVDDGGPLQGIVTALPCLSTALAVFVPVDMPHITREQLIEITTAAANDPSGRGRMAERMHGHEAVLEPFPCVLPIASRTNVQDLFAAGRRSMRSLVESAICERFDARHWPNATWTNLNTPQDLARFEPDGRSGD